MEADPYLQFVPSKLSAAALAVAFYSFNCPMWSKSLEENIGYRLDDLKVIVMHLENTHANAAELAQQAMQEKYKTSR